MARDVPYEKSSVESMSQEITTPVTITLKPVEKALQSLLLDVAQYIHDNPAVVCDNSKVTEQPQTVLRFTGGWVRDKLLGVDSNDIDVAISSTTGEKFGMALMRYLETPGILDTYYETNFEKGELAKAVGSLHKIEKNPEKSKHLETVTTRIFGLEVDLVNLRKETYSEDSRNPQMEFGTAEEDALRRDATINALFYNLNESVVEDFTGRGLEDMRNKLIRTPMAPYQTFKDDPLRVLRLIRFASRLGYRIDHDTEDAMQNPDIKEALKRKISKERIEKELQKMLRGPDPRASLHFINRLGLYATVFANLQDDAEVDTASWSLAYDALQNFMLPNADQLQATISRVRNILVREPTEAYYAWIIAAFAPWSLVPARTPTGRKSKPIPPRSVEVARDSLRADNRTMSVLRDVVTHSGDIIHTKSALLQGKLPGTAVEVRQQIGLRVRSWGKDWRLCMILAFLQEVMQGHDFSCVVDEYDQLLSYMTEHDLLGVTELKSLVNGHEILTALSAPMGPWMSKAVEMVVKWQLLHPDIKDKKIALAELAKRRAELGIPTSSK